MKTVLTKANFVIIGYVDPQRDRLFTKGPSGAFDRANSEITKGSKLGMDATKNYLCESCQRR